MNVKKQIAIGFSVALGLLVLLLDARTAILGAKAGIELCLYTVVPALFPFIVLSTIAGSLVTGRTTRILTSIGKLCKMPQGTESLLLLGLIGGYPVGAACIGKAYTNKQLCRADAERLLAFCNNAGPSFIFGMTSALFSSPFVPWMIWGIQIISSIMTGVLLNAGTTSSGRIPTSHHVGITDALNHGLHVTGVICGWVILFRIIIAFSTRWFLWVLPNEIGILYCGILELANGCAALQDITLDGFRFILCCAILSFGGICVTLQTMSVTPSLSCKTYFRGKSLQCILSFLLSCTLQKAMFPQMKCARIPILAVFFSLAAVFLLSGRISFKKSIAFSKSMMYNEEKPL